MSTRNSQLRGFAAHAARTVTTDYSGYAVYSFDLPKESEADEGTVTAEAKRGSYSKEVDLNFDLRSKGKLTLTTDKPLYQPGQEAHLRVLTFGPDKRGLAGRDLVVFGIGLLVLPVYATGKTFSMNGERFRSGTVGIVVSRCSVAITPEAPRTNRFRH